ncbi:hypothetical protein [Bacteroides sp. 51]|uniref:hypothetical protein n=1 Tax=Bacteroides sp. 51 TaxID=2302938 RepID=UPI0013D4266C|nr:hypothetical protein [Bacteroides sp. 51]NDV82068.1 hypothetical protein [Bacteroides sp. 51]
MDKKKFEAILPLKVQSVVKLMIERKGFSFRESLRYLYTSKLYHMLEREETKVWHYSPMLLLELVEKEKDQGIFELPDYV